MRIARFRSSVIFFDAGISQKSTSCSHFTMAIGPRGFGVGAGFGARTPSLDSSAVIAGGMVIPAPP